MTTKQTVALAQMIPQYRESQGHGKRKLLTPDEVLRLPHTEMLVIIRGQNLLKLNKFDYTKHPMSKHMLPVSIQNYNPIEIKTQTVNEKIPDIESIKLERPEQQIQGKSANINVEEEDDFDLDATPEAEGSLPPDF